MNGTIERYSANQQLGGLIGDEQATGTPGSSPHPRLFPQVWMGDSYLGIIFAFACYCWGWAKTNLFSKAVVYIAKGFIEPDTTSVIGRLRSPFHAFFHPIGHWRECLLVVKQYIIFSLFFSWQMWSGSVPLKRDINRCRVRYWEGLTPRVSRLLRSCY